MMISLVSWWFGDIRSLFVNSRLVHLFYLHFTTFTSNDHYFHVINNFVLLFMKVTILVRISKIPPLAAIAISPPLLLFWLNRPNLPIRQNTPELLLWRRWTCFSFWDVPFLSIQTFSLLLSSCLRIRFTFLIISSVFF